MRFLITGGAGFVGSHLYQNAYGAGFEDMARRLPDVGKIEQAIGWHANRSLERILDSVIDHQRLTGES